MKAYTLGVISLLEKSINDNNRVMLSAAIDVIKIENSFEADTLPSGKIQLQVGILADNSAPLYVITIDTFTNENGLQLTKNVAIVKNEMPTVECHNNGKSDNFEIDNESQLNEVNVAENEYSLHSTIVNQFGQRVEFYVANNEYDQVVAKINGTYYLTSFFDCGDFKKDSDYLPVTFNNKVYYYYSYYYASKEHYYPTK